jgi:bacterioferritin B
MEISQKLAKAITDQIGHEFQASQMYLAIAGYFREKELTLLHKIFVKQSNEEREHALKFLEYLWDTNNNVELPAVPAAKPGFTSSEDAVANALTWEKEVTRRINELMAIAIEDKDYLSQNFLKWFVSEQLEEENSMQQLLSVIRMSGERNLLMVEGYLSHLKKMD